MRPVLIDLYCKAGGAAMGYHRAGFDVVGVDIEPQPNYPFAFHQGDALETLAWFLRRTAEGRERIAAIHASPPCQFATAGNRTLRARGRSQHVNFVPATRAALVASGLPYVIENVEAARKHLIDPVMLCGRMFGLGATDTDGEWLTLDRHRLFESNVPLEVPVHERHAKVQVAGAYGGARRDKVEARLIRHGGYVPRDLGVLQRLLGIDWQTEKELFEAIPPAYTEPIGDQVLAVIDQRRAA